MHNKLPQRDPIKADKREAVRERRVGIGAKCACGESRPEALIPGREHVICAACDRKRDGKATFDNHHVAGKSNSPVTMPIWVNDHLAYFNKAQSDWPRPTLENRDGSPLLAAAACIRGFADLIVYLLKRALMWTAEMLEKLDPILREKLGPQWWIGTNLQEFTPERRSDDAE